MPCSHSGGGDKDRLSKRDFMKAAVAIGGASSVAAVSAHTDQSPRKPRDYAPWEFERTDAAERQHAWVEFLRTSGNGIRALPEHHVFLHLDYAKEGTPSESDRQELAATLETFERAYEWSNHGLLFTVSYSQRYFDRFDEDLPEQIDLRYPEEVIEEADLQKDREDAVAEDDDVHVHLTSDHPQAVLRAEQALLGEGDTVNGVDVETDMSGIFEVSHRRTGFVDQRVGGIRKSNWGKSKPHNRFEEDVPGENPVPRDAPVFFGFKSLFTDSQPHQDHVTFTDEENPFEGGTIVQASLIKDDIKAWYDDHEHEDQIHRMYSPHHTPEETGKHGRNLPPRSGTEDEPMISLARKAGEDSEQKGVVGHAQKLARARDPLPPLLRRDVPSTHENHPHLQFVSLQKSVEDFITVRQHMSFIDPEGDQRAEEELPLEDHGILGYLETKRRGTYLMPPRDVRAFPRPNPDR